MKGAVTSCKAEVGAGERYFETQVIDENLVHLAVTGEVGPRTGNCVNKKMQQHMKKMDIPDVKLGQHVPDLFRLPVLKVEKDKSITIDLTFVEPLVFKDGHYCFEMDFMVDAECLPSKRTFQEAFIFTASVDNVVGNSQVLSDSMDLVVEDNGGNRGVISVSGVMKSPGASNVDMRYSMLSDEIVTTGLIEPSFYDPVTKEEEGTIIIFATPPRACADKPKFSRMIVFAIDRSESMLGDPFAEAVRGIQAALQLMREGDSFSVLLFDHEMVAWNEDLVEYSQGAGEACIAWVRENAPAHGSTDIYAALGKSLKMLARRYNKNAAVLPFVFLLTDGAVCEERDICKYVAKNAGPCRVLTFGVGEFCNWHFLRVLGEIGRGFSHTSAYPDLIAEKIKSMFEMTQEPVLTNLSIQGPDAVPLSHLGCELELYPSPVPDLFAGRPLVMAVSYAIRGGQSMPQSLMIVGCDSEGPVGLEVELRQDPRIPVSSVFAKQHLDILTAREWLKPSKELGAQIASNSLAENIPTTHTRMMTFEIDKKKAQAFYDEQYQSHVLEGSFDLAEEEEDERDDFVSSRLSTVPSWRKKIRRRNIGNRRRSRKGSYISTADRPGTKRHGGLKKRGNTERDMKRAKRVAMVAVDGSLILSTTVVSEGDLMSTFSNAPALGDVGLAGLLDDSGCCERCKIC
jgi:uncharacterized protein YegL